MFLIGITAWEMSTADSQVKQYANVFSNLPHVASAASGGRSFGGGRLHIPRGYVNPSLASAYATYSYADEG